ncbi:MAG TPA: hypothetical protein PLI96_09265 [Halothiobacillus sp.]|nr:hypothetical protein [Halothiobacillus sp.]
MIGTPKKTPKDTTEFEREQLRFFLEKEDVAAVLLSLNPSLAWLPLLAELKLIDAKTYLAPWIEKNFTEVDAIKEVAANIRFFESEPDTANILEFRLSRTEGLSELLMTCWRFIIQHMRNSKRGLLNNEWFEIEPRIRHGDLSHELLERLADLLRPRIQVGKYFSLRPEKEGGAPQRPTDLISIKFEADENHNEEEVLSALPENLPAEIYEALLRLLDSRLNSALIQATEAGVENNLGYSLTDADVPSVAHSPQNAYRKGFLPIVRVIAEVWTLLSLKDASLALDFTNHWQQSRFRLIRRLALFAAADAVVPARMAATMLMRLPVNELFLTSSTVEVYRLINARWSSFTPRHQLHIVNRMAKGPAPDWFLERKDEMVDHCRFELLGHLERIGVQLSAVAQSALDDIKNRWPNWELQSEERAGFHVWHGGVTSSVDDASKLEDVPDDQLIPTVKAMANGSGLFGGDSWRGLCQAEPMRALNGLNAEAERNQWPDWAWRSFLWSAPGISDVGASAQIAQLLLQCPDTCFSEIAVETSWWLNETVELLDEGLLWPLWDRIAGVHLTEPENEGGNHE